MHSSPSRAFIGSYTIGTASKGIYTMLLDDDGTTNSIALAAEQKNPSFLCSVPSTRTLYAVEESYGTTGEEGAVWAYQTGTAGALKARTRVGSRGVGPCTLSVDHRHTTLFTANFHSGSLVSIRLKHDGVLDNVISVIQLHGSSVHPQRQVSSHPHAIVPTPDNQHLLVTDLGADKLLVFDFDQQHSRISCTPQHEVVFPPGSGPRHLAIHPSGKFVYVIHEISSVVTMHHLGGPGIISQPLQTLPVHPEGFIGEADAADIVIDKTGSLLYTSTRQTSTLSSFLIDRTTGRLSPAATVASGGKSPHALALPPQAHLLLAANIESGSVATFSTDASGCFSLIGHAAIPSPSSILFL